MTHHNRRTFLKVSGAVLGGIATGSTVVASTRTDRFIVETSGRKALKGLDVVHEMPGVDFAVVRGSESELEDARGVKGYAPDIEVQLNEPDVNDEVPAFDASDYEGQPGDFLQWDKADLNVPKAHETTEGEGTRVAIIDTGVLETHPDLKGPLNTKLSQNFTDDEGDHNPVGGGDHGTHVAGIVAADNGGGTGVNGTAPKTELVDCRVFSGEGATFADILAAIVYSVNINADAANLSLGAYPVPRQGQGQFYGKVLNSVMTYANKEGTLLVIAAGNDSADLQKDKNFISLPNEGAQGLSVAATGPIGYGWDADGDGDTADLVEPPESPAFYTNYGTNDIVLGAPGGDADPSAIGSGVPWFRDLVFNTVFAHNGELVSGTFGSKTDEYPGTVTAEWRGDFYGEVSVSGDPPYTTDDVPWYSSVGFGGVRFGVGTATFTGEETVTVDYNTGSDHERGAPDWISLQVVVPGDGDEEDTNYVVIDWQVDENSGTTVSWTASDSFGDEYGGVFEAGSVEEIFADNDIDPSSPTGNPRDVIGKGLVQSVGVYSGGGIGRDDSVDITYTGVDFEGDALLIPQTPGYGWKAGTSMAAPNVAGAAALVKSANPNYNANQVESALKGAAEVPDGYDKAFYGSGYLNILDAL
ncbi:S8 family serine peptidase [Natronomonas halophila]|uniref:S8 family peptidase n=1 Tax=Natronomonas halophila TaxID=2747817 RepID=UPI0015B62DA9|nr:S8 family serine peptidase [Natronomonas halophila]QLD84284.1 S8 family serine peptidase [Natronomonas halophila]